MRHIQVTFDETVYMHIATQHIVRIEQVGDYFTGKTRIFTVINPEGIMADNSFKDVCKQLNQTDGWQP